MQFVRFMAFGVSFCGAIAAPASAQDQIAEQDGLGIELEELLSEKGTFRLEFGTTLSAAREKGVTGLFQTIETGTGDFVTVPIDIGSTDRQSETVLGDIGLRYGLSTRSEVYARATLRTDRAQFTDSTTGLTETLSDASFQSLVIGMNYRFVDEGERLGLIGFADVALLENTAARGTDLQPGRSGTLGFTTYRVLDPVVLSLTAGYRANLDRTFGDDVIDPGDILFINPSVAFAVNNELTLTSGFGLDFSGDDRLNGIALGGRSTSADLQFGMAYAWSENTTLSADTRTEVLRDNNFTAGITLTHKFGRN